MFKFYVVSAGQEIGIDIRSDTRSRYKTTARSLEQQNNGKIQTIKKNKNHNEELTIKRWKNFNFIFGKKFSVNLAWESTKRMQNVPLKETMSRYFCIMENLT